MADIKKVFISELELGQTVISVFAVRKKHLRPFQDKPGQFLELRLADRTGEIQAMMWEEAEEAAKGFAVGDPVLIRATVGEYKNKPQLVVDRIRRAKEEEYKRSDFVAGTDKDKKALFNEVLENVDRVQNPHLNRLLHAFFDDREFVRSFVWSPGAHSIHHAYLGGLLEHTVHLLRLANLVCDLYPRLNRDLMMVGALLHDIGKIQELESDVSIEYTDEGKLVGHLVMGYGLTMARIATLPDFPETLRALVGNLLLAHHGRYEFGTPILPKTAEAEVLYHLDYADSQAQRMLSATDRQKQEGPTDRWGFFYDHGERRELFLQVDEVLAQAEATPSAADELPLPDAPPAEGTLFE